MSLFTKALFSMGVLVVTHVDCNKNNIIARENLNALVIRNMQHQIKTMEASLKLVQASCGNILHRRDNIIAFHAKLGSQIKDWKTDRKIVFDNVVLNEGRGYDNNTGVFTAPSHGVYVFEWTILTYPGYKFHVELMVQGKTAAITHNKSPKDGQISTSSSLVVKLRKDDEVWLEPIKQVGQYAYGDWTYLSGFKL